MVIEVTENLLQPRSETEENSVPLRRLIKEIKEGLVKDGLTDLPTGMNYHKHVIYAFVVALNYLFSVCNVKCACCKCIVLDIE